MADITVMSTALSNQIAAGEVIERPASVVKELVENAIDANASQVDVRVVEAGLHRIEVVDNGEGMSSKNVHKAFERHATSKLNRDADLFRIKTLGFRGEALPSIASVSELIIETATENESGTHLKLEGGVIIEDKPAPSRVGTMILVENLFYNTPARLKYIKSMKTELSHVTDMIQRFAFSHPDIAFRLTSDDKLVIKTVGNGDLKQTIANVYGVDVAKKMVKIENEDFNYQIEGYVSLPELTRSSRKYMTLIINGRVIKNFALNRAIETGYGSKLMINRHPFAVLNINMDSQLIDVNVHPTKEEVRIADENEVGKLIKQAINNAMQQTQRIPDGLSNMQSKRKQKLPRYEQTAMELKSQQNKRPTNPYENTWVEETSDTVESRPGNRKETADIASDQGLNVALEIRQELMLRDHVDESPIQTADKLMRTEDDRQEDPFPELDYFGQMHGTYLFAQNEMGLYIVDQHAAQERIKYEHFRVEIGRGQNNQQHLLVPIILEYPAADAITIKDNLDKLANIGLELEDFGENTFMVQSHPTWFEDGQEEATIREMIDFFLTKRSISVAEFREATAIMMSCKRSIKANHHLDEYQARELLRQLPQCENPYNCPHGRPVLIHLTNSDMEKMFKRIQDH